MRPATFFILLFLVFSFNGFGRGEYQFGSAGSRSLIQYNFSLDQESGPGGLNKAGHIRKENKLDDPASLEQLFAIPAPVYHCSLKNNSNPYLSGIVLSPAFIGLQHQYYNNVVRPLKPASLVFPHHHFW